MIDNKYLKHLIESPLVYYVYQRGSTIYGTNTKNSDLDFLVVIDASYQVPKEFKPYKIGNPLNKIQYRVIIDNCDFIFYEIQDWFNHVLNCQIDAWECACLDKKFIYKEHVKLLMETNPLKLRKNFDSYLSETYKRAQYLLQHNNYDLAKKWLISIINNVKLTNQILINHKIVNFKEIIPDSELIKNSSTESEILETFNNCLESPLDFLKKSTDGIKKQYLLNKFKEEHKDDE